MELLFYEKINVYNFVCDFFNILRYKNINSIDYMEFKKIIYHLKNTTKYKNVFKDIDVSNLDQTIRMLQITKFISVFKNNPNTLYIKGDNQIKTCNNELRKLLEEIVDSYIFITKNNKKYNNLNIYLCDQNTIRYKLVNGYNSSIKIKWNIITDGVVLNNPNIMIKKFYPSIKDENIILFLNNAKIKNVLINNSTFVLNQGIINESIVKNELYVNVLNEEFINKLSKYFENKNVDNEKVKILTLK